jgi:hypothetical protein
MNDQFPNNELELYDELYSELRRISRLMLESTNKEEQLKLNLQLVKIQKEINELDDPYAVSSCDEYY